MLDSQARDNAGRSDSSRNVRRIVGRVAAALVGICMLVVGAVLVMFGGELKTLGTIEKIDDYPLYTMDYAADYGLDEFLEQGGASNDAELIDFVVSRLLKGLPIQIELPDLACSTFNAETPEGEALFARNFDLEFSPGMMVRTTPKDGYASISMVNLAFIGYGEDKLPEDFASSIVSLAAPFAPLDGVNEKGLAVGVLLIDTEATHQETERVDITTTTAIRLMLDRCATVDEAVDLLSQYDMHASGNRCYHFQIADASGDSVVVEYIDNEMRLVEPGEEGYQAATNFLLTPGDYDFGGGQDRYETVMSALDAADGVMTEQAAMDTLQSVSREVKIRDNGEVFQTQWSVVYNLDRASAIVCMGGKYDELHEIAVAKQ